MHCEENYLKTITVIFSEIVLILFDHIYKLLLYVFVLYILYLL